jgi:hypothetical protein
MEKKKTLDRKLTLSRETLHRLDERELSEVAGAARTFLACSNVSFCLPCVTDACTGG